MTKKELEFVNYVKSECKKYNVKCDLRKTKYVKLSGSIKCSGYFESDDVRPVLVCSMNRKDWIEILAHEFCHLTQWVEKFKLWDPAMESMNIVDNWLNGEDVSNIQYHAGLCRDLELDNEKRTVKLIKKFGLKVNIDQYIKKANSYILFYNHMLSTRRWTRPNNSPYGNKRLVNAMPSNFRIKYTKTPKHLEKIYIEENI